MKLSGSKILLWSPRALSILFALFISLFALDVFADGVSIFKSILAFLIHLVPTYIIIITLIVSWKREWIGAFIYTILGIAYIIMTWNKFSVFAYLLISGPLFLMGILFGINWILKGNTNVIIDKKPRKNHHDRDDMTGEHKFGDAGQAGFAILFFIVWISDTFYFRYTTFLNDLVPNAIRAPIGIILLIISGYLAKTTLLHVFGEVREVPCVIRTGFYKYSRHPMYFSEVLLYLGLLIISMSLAAALVWVLAIAFLFFLCRHEEKLLLDRFGDDYRKYMQEVPMWIPRWRKGK